MQPNTLQYYLDKLVHLLSFRHIVKQWYDRMTEISPVCLSFNEVEDFFGTIVRQLANVLSY